MTVNIVHPGNTIPEPLRLVAGLRRCSGPEVRRRLSPDTTIETVTPGPRH
jgi:hypothetical protein